MDDDRSGSGARARAALPRDLWEIMETYLQSLEGSWGAIEQIWIPSFCQVEVVCDDGQVVEVTPDAARRDSGEEVTGLHHHLLNRIWVWFDRDYCLKKSLSGTDSDIASWVFDEVRDRHRVVKKPGSRQVETHYMFTGIIWERQEMLMYIIMSDRTFRARCLEFAHRQDSAASSEDDSESRSGSELSQHHPRTKKQKTKTPRERALLLAHRLSQIDSARRIFHVVCEMLAQYDPQFEERLNRKQHLLAFTNGVVDLRTKTFRPYGRPDDELTLSTHQPYLSELPRALRDDVEQFMGDLFPDEALCDYVWWLLGRSLAGTHGFMGNIEVFFLFTGVGRNGKSTLMRLLSRAMGDYFSYCDVSLFTQKRAPGHSATPNLLVLKDKRFVISAEPEARDTLSLGFIKEISGGETLTARDLFKSCTHFEPVCMSGIMSNAIPRIITSPKDKGTWRRIMVIPFKTEFVDTPEECTQRHQVVANRDLYQVMETTWPAAFMTLLVERCCPSWPVPECVKQENQRLHQRFGACERFVEEMVTVDESAFTSLKTLWPIFREWTQRQNLDYAPRSSDVFEEHITCVLGEPVIINRQKGWRITLSMNE